MGRDTDHLPDGVSLAERFFEESLDGDLHRAITMATSGRIAEFGDHVRAVMSTRRFVGSEVDTSWTSLTPLVEPDVSLPSTVPLAERNSFLRLLLVAPSILVSDPVLDWAEPTLRSRILQSFMQPGDEDVSSEDALRNGIRGLRGLGSLLKSRDIVLVPTGGLELGTFPRRYQEMNVDLLARIDAGTANGSNAAAQMETLMGAKRHELQMAFDIDSVAAKYRANLVPARLGPLLLLEQDQVEDIAIEIPQLDNFDLRSALNLRAGEASFAMFRAALRETIAAAGRSMSGETQEAYASRLQDVASAQFEPLIGKFWRRSLAGKAAGMATKVPGAMLSLGLAFTDIPGLSLAGAAVGIGIDKVMPNPLQRHVDEGTAAHAGRALALKIGRDGYL